MVSKVPGEITVSFDPRCCRLPMWMVWITNQIRCVADVASCGEGNNSMTRCNSYSNASYGVALYSW